MPINPEAVGSKGEPTRSSWNSKDSILYALGVGAGTADLPFVTENSIGIDQQALPTMGVVLANLGGAFGKIGTFNPAMLVHGEQRIRLHRPMPVAGEIDTVAEITGIFDKGKGAVIEVTGRSVDVATNEPLFDTVMSTFIRGEGGWGGDRGPSGAQNVAPERAPDAAVSYQTSPTRRCCTGFQATGTRCIRIRSSLLSQVLIDQSFTVFAPTASPAERS